MCTLALASHLIFNWKSFRNNNNISVHLDGMFFDGGGGGGC
jgi:hypothetical protein